jgi:hypothetical protein
VNGLGKICERRRHRAEGRREGQSVDPAVGLDVDQAVAG